MGSANMCFYKIVVFPVTRSYILEYCRTSCTHTVCNQIDAISNSMDHLLHAVKWPSEIHLLLDTQSYCIQHFPQRHICYFIIRPIFIAADSTLYIS